MAILSRIVHSITRIIKLRPG